MESLTCYTGIVRIDTDKSGVKATSLFLYATTAGGLWWDMKEYAASFYKSKAWQRCRSGYIKSVGGLCERCLAEGRIVPGVIVHHKIYVTPENINEPSVILNWDNLELLCREHHEQEHARQKKRYTIDECGRVTAV